MGLTWLIILGEDGKIDHGCYEPRQGVKLEVGEVVVCTSPKPFKYESQTALFKDPVNTFHLGYKKQLVYAVSGTSRCLFSDKYKTHKYSVGREYNC